MGLMNARKLRKRRQKFRDNKLPDKKKRLGITLKFDPLGRSSQAKGIVTKKVQKEAKQPNSAMRKFSSSTSSRFTVGLITLRLIFRHVCLADTTVVDIRLHFLPLHFALLQATLSLDSEHL